MKPPPPPIVGPPKAPPPPLSPLALVGPPAPPVVPSERRETPGVPREEAGGTALSREEHLASALFSSARSNRDADAKSDARAPLPLKTVVGHYTILSLMGRGGHGITYQARNNIKGNLVVIKEHMPLGMVSREPGSMEVSFPSPKAEARFEASMSEFLEEITVLQALEYPGIVPIIDSFEANDTAYYVMPFIAGTILRVPEKISLNPAHKRQDAARLHRILLSLLRTLEYLEQHKIVHRDIKPENILITKHGQAVLLDFGSARQLRAGRVFTNTYTPDYCAPEQGCARSDEQMSQALSQRTDIYSLGVSFYFLISHLMPPRAEMRAHSVPDPYKPLAKRPELQDLYGTVFLEGIDRALEFDQADRWENAAAWRESLEQDRSSLPPHLIKKLRVAAAVLLLVLLVVGGLVIYALRERSQVRVAYDSGLNFTEQILYDFSTELVDLPGSGNLRRRLSSGLQKYLAALRDMPEGRYTRLDRAMAAAWFNIGCNYMALGQLNEAETALHHAESLEALISGREPDDQRFRYELSRTHLRLAELSVRMARYREGMEHAVSAVRSLELLYRMFPDNPDYGSALGEALILDFSLRRDEYDEDARESLLNRALALFREQVKHFPRHLASYAGLASALYYCGRHAKDIGDFKAAESYLAETLKIYTNLTDNYPYRLSLKRGLARVLYHSGELYFFEALAENVSLDVATKSRRSGELFDEYIELVRDLRGLDADNTEYIFLECRALAAKADLLLRQNKPNEAVNCCRILTEQADALFANEPDNKDYLSVRAAALCLQAVAHKRSGRLKTQATSELAEARSMLQSRVDSVDRCPDDLRFSYTEALALSAADAIENGSNDQATAWIHAADVQMSLILSHHKHISPRQKHCLELLSQLKTAVQKSTND